MQSDKTYPTTNTHHNQMKRSCHASTTLDLVSDDIKMSILSFVSGIDAMTGLFCASQTWHRFRSAERAARWVYHDLYTPVGQDSQRISHAIARIEAAAFGIPTEQWTWSKRLHTRWAVQRHRALDNAEQPKRYISPPHSNGIWASGDRTTILSASMYGCDETERKMLFYKVDLPHASVSSDVLAMGERLHRVYQTLPKPNQCLRRQQNAIKLVEDDHKQLATLSVPGTVLSSTIAVDVIQNTMLISCHQNNRIWNVQLVDIATMAQLGTWQSKSDCAFEKTLIDGKCYDATKTDLQCLDARTGKILHSRPHYGRLEVMRVSTSVTHVFVECVSYLTVYRRSDMTKMYEIQVTPSCVICIIDTFLLSESVWLGCSHVTLPHCAHPQSMRG